MAPGEVVATTVAVVVAATAAGRLAMSRASPAGAGVDAGGVGAAAVGALVAATDVGAVVGGGVGAACAPDASGLTETGALAEATPLEVEPGVVADWELRAAATTPGVDGPLGETPVPAMPKLPLIVARTSTLAASDAPIPATAEYDNLIDRRVAPFRRRATAPAAAAPAGGAAVKAIRDWPHSPHQ